MNNIHFITGIPRSGSTLLCNILNQNPAFYASSTSPLPAIVQSMVSIFSTSQEIQAAMIRDEKGTEVVLNAMVKNVIHTWYWSKSKENIIFDKSRGWSFNSLLIAKIFPDAKIIACVRDLRGVFGSVEKQHAKNPVIDRAENPNGKTVLNRAEQMLSPDGFIGQCVIGTNDVVARMPKRVFTVNYESFTRTPESTMRELYEFLELDYYAHDFENVENVAEDIDGLYHNKFPHVGSGKVTPCNRNEWQEFLPDDLGKAIFQRYPDYNKNFGYQ